MQKGRYESGPELMYATSMLVDADLADQVWELWNAGVITDDSAEIAWFLVATTVPVPDTWCELG